MIYDLTYISDACKYLPNGVHDKSTLLSRTSGSALSVSDVTRSDLDMLQSLLAKFGLKAPNTSTPSHLVAYTVSVPLGFPSVSAQLSAQPTYVSPQLLPGSFGGSNMGMAGLFPQGVQYPMGSLQQGVYYPQQGFKHFLVHRRGYPSVAVGDGLCIPVTNSGHSVLSTPFCPLRLNNVLITPNIVKNLIFIRQFVHENSCTVVFDPFDFFVKYFITRWVLLRCDSTGDLYPVTNSSTIHHAFLTSQYTWHQRLGHPRSEVLRRLVSTDSISCNKEKLPVLCHACQLGKHVKLPFVSSSSSVTSCFDIVHSDLWTSPIPSLSGFQYYVLFLNHYSQYVWVYPLMNKSDVLSKFMLFRNYVRTQFKCEMKSFQCDHGAPVHTPQVDVPTPPTPPTPPPLPTPQSVPQTVPEHAPAPTNDSSTVSIHPMVTRSRVGATRPNPRYAGHVFTISPLPRSYKEAFNDPNWRNAMFDDRYKARLVANGSTQGDDTMFWLLYVDDIVLTASSDRLLQQIIASLHRKFFITDLGALNYFLGISVTRDTSGMFLSQRKYAMEILERAHMVGCNPSRTPVDTESKLRDGGTLVVDHTLYWSLAGSLQYLTFTRPNITYTVQQVCLYMHHLREPHFSTLKRIFRYVQGTLDYGLQLFSSTTDSLIAYSDADWAGCPTTRRSTLGYCVSLGNNLLSWSFKRQPTLSRSSVEAECRGVANAVAETCWIRNLLRELHTSLSSATIVYCDNVSAVYLSFNPVQHQRTKHIEIDIHFVRDLVATRQVRVLHVPFRFQYADIFTKDLPSALFDEFRDSLSVHCTPAPTVGAY
nr:ribonuclease H-like domain-containing protein [Tanacetum cinerariifolium]